MTWPFENDTSAIVKRISNRSVSANRKRNIFIALTIALAGALLSAIVLYGFGVIQEMQNRNQKTAQIMYHAISEQQGQELYHQEEIAWVGEFFNAFSEQVNHSTVQFIYANADMLKSQSMPYWGDLPALADEIVVQEAFLNSLGYSNELGQMIQIPFSDGTIHDFKLTGILDVKTGDIGRYTAIISKELVRQKYGSRDMIDYYIGLKGAQNMSEERAAGYADTLAQQLKISDDDVIIRSTYFNLRDENRGSAMLFYFLIGFITFIGSGIVIYSIFYISVASSTRNYGQLRTIGTTKRQIKKMVYREGKLLAAIGIPIGLVAGNVIGYFLVPAGWYWLTALCVTVGVGLFAFMIVMIAIRTPVKRAAAVSPMEALRYSDYKGKMKESSVLHRNITPASLAKMNLSRQKGKSILTILSLSLGGVLIVLIATMLVSYDGVAEARGRAFPAGEFNIKLNANQSFDTAHVSLTELQRKNLYHNDFEKAIESIDGVAEIVRWYYTDAEYSVNGNSEKWIQGFRRDEQQNLEKERIAGTVDYDELIAGNGIVLLQERAGLYDIEAALGDTVEVNYQTESGDIHTKAYTIMGIVNEYSYCGFPKCFTLPEQLMNEAAGIDCTGAISVMIDPDKFDAVEAALDRLIDGNSDLVMETIKESITYYTGLQQLSFGVLLIVAVIVVCFSLINLVNTTITNFLSRRQEIGMLQAIGLSKKQLIKMLCYEGLLYSAFSVLVTLVMGTGLGFLSVQAVVKTMNPYFYYSFPWLVVLIYLGILLIVQFILTSYTTGNLKKQSLVEQIRARE
ncbi:MAG: ABC transporter permease [Oscillospiraceae bacterium]|jgi:putative ABC transport system permease protein|nr:ABC transporter permease [Oscillospiraceae bacterium]